VGFRPCQHSYSLCHCSLKLFIELIDRDLVDEVLDIFFSSLDSESDTDVDLDKDVVVGWARFYRQIVNNALLGNKKLYLCPG
jgi:hypothetical protein